MANRNARRTRTQGRDRVPGVAWLFHRALAIDEFPEALPLLRDFAEKSLREPPANEAEPSPWAGVLSPFAYDAEVLRERLRRVGELRSQETSVRLSLLSGCADSDLMTACRSVLSSYAPAGLLDGAWLGAGSYASPAMHHTALASFFLRCYEYEGRVPIVV
jgi:hypothetical protein